MGKQSKIQDIDHGWKHIKGELKAMKDAHVTIGVHESAPAYEDGTSQAQVAFWNEFGTTRGLPERPFIRTTADEKRNIYANFMKKEIDAIFHGVSTVRKSLERLGTKAQGDVRRKIKSIKTPPNAPSTIAAKGSSNPLIDSSTMLKSIDYEVHA